MTTNSSASVNKFGSCDGGTRRVSPSDVQETQACLAHRVGLDDLQVRPSLVIPEPPVALHLLGIRLVLVHRARPEGPQRRWIHWEVELVVLRGVQAVQKVQPDLDHPVLRGLPVPLWAPLGQVLQPLLFPQEVLQVRKAQVGLEHRGDRLGQEVPVVPAAFQHGLHAVMQLPLVVQY
ncbi:hypothetical protein GBAR_LOCUS19699 [Geodia barretti]|uniref:Uncharacterized protein n=1 Tax=Geodia barretti TaxID=519541 RepID=A0AA35X263_GEOBA|nr:hypothetical protein GBAR_LOCUS19699 [Geodia barretti]